MLDLLAMAKPLEPVRFPNGREFPVRPLDAAGWELLRKVEQANDLADALALLRRIVPEAADEDLATLGVEDVRTLIQYAARQIVVGLETAGNSPGAAATREMASASAPSSPIATPSPS